MKRTGFRFIVVLTVVLVLPSFSFSGRGIQIKEKRIALVVGNGSYKSAPLRNTPNDAYDMAETLKNLGFEVIHKKNVGLREMEMAIREFGKRLRNGGIGLFYFAGHGIQLHGRNYLIPVNSKIETESDVKYEAIDAGRILGKMEDAENDLNIIILDACRDNPFARSFRSQQKGLVRMDAPTGTIIAYATAPGMVAADGEGRNGIYTKHLLRKINFHDIPVEQMFKQVRIAVIDETENKQVPWESTSLKGDFYFNPKKETQFTKKSPEKGEKDVTKREDYELLFWESIKDTNNADMYESYLNKFPQGMFANLAKIKINQMKKKDVIKREFGEEKKIISKEKSKMAYISKDVKDVQITLRSFPKSIGKYELSGFLKKYNFYESKKNLFGDFKNIFVENGDGTITDTITGLMWQKEGSKRSVRFIDGISLLEKNLNKKKFAGYSDWRIPTIEELSSLIERKGVNKLHIDPIFESRQARCWSSDADGKVVKKKPKIDHWAYHYFVDFKNGSIGKAKFFTGTQEPYTPQYEFNSRNYIRAVRSF